MLILPTLLALTVLPVTLPRFLADPPLPPEIEGVAIPALLPILLPYHTKAKQSEGGAGRQREQESSSKPEVGEPSKFRRAGRTESGIAIRAEYRKRERSESYARIC